MSQHLIDRMGAKIAFSLVRVEFEVGDMVSTSVPACCVAKWDVSAFGAPLRGKCKRCKRTSNNY